LKYESYIFVSRPNYNFELKYPPSVSNGDIAEAISASLQSNLKHMMHATIVPNIASVNADIVSDDNPFKFYISSSNIEESTPTDLLL
jgi:hypothetical protein